MNYKKFSKRAFTLVELIIVIAIIAILAVTAFLLLTKWLSKARDSSRTSNLANIENSLQISLTDNSSLPKPDSYTLIYASGTSNVIGYQGYFGEGVKDAVGNINSAPKDGDDYFTYYLNADLNKYQLAGFMENTTAYNPNMVNAVDYSSRFVTVKGEKLGLLTDANKSPLQSLGLTGLDILNTTNSYTAYFTNTESINGTGKFLKSLRGVGYGLTNYWSFDEIGNIAYDTINGGTDGELTGGVLRIAGKLGTGLQFGNTANDAVLFRKSFFNLKSDYTWAGWINISNIDTKLAIYSEGNPHVTLGLNYSSGTYNGNIIGTTIKVVNSGARCGFITTDNALNINQWYHVTFTFKNLSDDWNSGIAKYYLNGKKMVERTYLRLNNPTTQYSAIGNNVGGFFTGTQSKASFPGQIDEVRIYNRALSDDEVKALYDATK